jgi:hypothetical protein
LKSYPHLVVGPGLLAMPMEPLLMQTRRRKPDLTQLPVLSAPLRTTASDTAKVLPSPPKVQAVQVQVVIMRRTAGQRVR